MLAVSAEPLPLTPPVGRPGGNAALRLGPPIGAELAGNRDGRRLVERIGAQPEARRDGDGLERQAHRGRRRLLAVGQPEVLGLVAGAETMDGNRALGLGAQFGPQHAADADRRALGGEGLLVADMEAIAGLHVAIEAEHAGEGLPRLEHRGRRHARLRQRGVERSGDDAVDRDLAREGLVGRDLRRLVRAAQQALLGERARHRRRCRPTRNRETAKRRTPRRARPSS